MRERERGRRERERKRETEGGFGYVVKKARGNGSHPGGDVRVCMSERKEGGMSA
jgi:hypothetical protein